MLLVPQGRPRINTRRSPGRRMAGENRGAYQDDAGQHQGCRIVGPGLDWFWLRRVWSILSVHIYGNYSGRPRFQAAARHRCGGTANQVESLGSDPGSALRAHLKNLDIRDRELRGRKGYEASPGDPGACRWEVEAVWPAE